MTPSIVTPHGSLKMPNMRKMLTPDPGMTIIEVDLQGADARVVAWEADDEPLKAAFRAGLPIHAVNARSIFPDEVGDASLRAIRNEKRFAKVYLKSKIGVHAVNYGCKARTLASHLNITIGAAEQFIAYWLQAHPGIEAWHRRIEAQLYSRRTVSNAFGYSIRYFDRPDGLLPQALAWIGQSTTSIAVNRILVALAAIGPEIEILLQTHDSVTFQVHTDALADLWAPIRAACRITVPYPDPLEMPVSFSTSTTSWGDVKEMADA